MSALRNIKPGFRMLYGKRLNKPYVIIADMSVYHFECCDVLGSEAEFKASLSHILRHRIARNLLTPVSESMSVKSIL